MSSDITPENKPLQWEDARHARRQRLFTFLLWVLGIDLLLFAGLLVMAFAAVAFCKANWHVFIAPGMAGALAAVLGVALMRGVFGLHGKDVSNDVDTLARIGAAAAESAAKGLG